MRAESDKKEKNTSVSMIQSDFEIITQKANERGMKISPYMVECSVHSQDSVTPEKKAKMQSIVNKLCMIAEDIAPDKVNDIRREAEGIWSL